MAKSKSVFTAFDRPKRGRKSKSIFDSPKRGRRKKRGLFDLAIRNNVWKSPCGIVVHHGQTLCN